MPKPKLSCSLCDSPVDGRSLRSPQKLENRILDLIRQDRPEWEANRGICPNCLETYRAKKFVGYLEAEYQKLSEIEHAVVSKFTRRGRVSGAVHQEVETRMTSAERVADKVAESCGRCRVIDLSVCLPISWLS